VRSWVGEFFFSLSRERVQQWIVFYGVLRRKKHQIVVAVTPKKKKKT
jgi:hypothetical protein